MFVFAGTTRLSRGLNVFKFPREGTRAPLKSRRIPIWLIHEAKMDGHQKARMVAGGHVTPAPTEETHDSVAKGESAKIVFLIAVMNGLDLSMGDMKNAFLNARTTERAHILCGPEFGANEGETAVMQKAIHGLKSSAANFHHLLADTLCSMGFPPSKCDENVWMRQEKDGSHSCTCSHVDDFLSFMGSTQNHGRDEENSHHLWSQAT